MAPHFAILALCVSAVVYAHVAEDCSPDDEVTFLQTVYKKEAAVSSHRFELPAASAPPLIEHEDVLLQADGFQSEEDQQTMNRSDGCDHKNDGIRPTNLPCRCRGGTYCDADKPYCTDPGGVSWCSAYPTCDGAKEYGVYPQPMKLGGCQCGAHTCIGTSDDTMCTKSGCKTKSLDCAYDDVGAPKSMESFESCCGAITGNDDDAVAKCKLAKCVWNGFCTHSGEFNLGGRQKYKNVRPDWLKTYFNEAPCEPLGHTTANCLRGVMSKEGTDVARPNHYFGNNDKWGLRWEIASVDGVAPAQGIYAGELMLKCGTDEATVQLEMGTQKNGLRFDNINSLKIYMNEVLDTTITRGDLGVWPSSWKAKVRKLTAGQRAFDHLRIEVDAEAGANFKSVLTLQDATAFFDGCMEAKECLVHLTGVAGDHLRQNNNEQLTCLTTTPSDTCENDNVCACWKDCLAEEGSLAITTAILKAALDPSSSSASASSAPACTNENHGPTDPYGDGCADYVQYPSWCGNYDDDDFESNTMCCACAQASATSMVEVGQAALNPSSASASATSMVEVRRDSTCFTPNFGDPEAFMCDCLDGLMNECQMCDGAGWDTPSCVNCIKSELCHSEAVCTDWKNSDACTNIPAPSSLMQRTSLNATRGALGGSDSAKKKKITSDLKEGAASLTDASGKEKMDEALERKSNQC